jgi:hypothetical protein
VPEEAALLSVVALIDRGRADEAVRVLETLAPWMDQLRFYPRPIAGVQPEPGRVSRCTVGEVADALREVQSSRRVLVMNEALSVWGPMYDELVTLALELVEGAVPTHARDDAGDTRRDASGQPIVVGGTVRRSDEAWRSRCRAYLARYAALRQLHPRSTQPDNPRRGFCRLRRAVAVLAVAPGTEGQRRRVRKLVAAYVARRGVPGGETLRALRRAQAAHAARPPLGELARTTVTRLEPLPQDQGLADADALVADLPLPPTLLRKVRMAQLDTLEGLVARGLVPSAEVLARLSWKVTASTHAAGFRDPSVRALAAATYRAFRARRSLLLTQLASQVRITELPWVAGLASLRVVTDTQAADAEALFRRLVMLVARTWPDRILPNPFVRELRELAARAGLDLPLLEEIAADIFQGRLVPKFTAAARHARDVLRGNTYERYYELQLAYGALERSCDLVDLGRDVAGGSGGWGVVHNGQTLEGVAVLTTHNLAVLLPWLDDVDRYATASLAASRALSMLGQVRDPGYVSLRRFGSAARAWRQHVFWLSLLPKDQQMACLDATQAQLQTLPLGVRRAMLPQLRRLRDAVLGRRVTGAAFFGWRPRDDRPMFDALLTT